MIIVTKAMKAKIKAKETDPTWSQVLFFPCYTVTSNTLNTYKVPGTVLQALHMFAL